jgi:hypothetical protein
MMLWKTPAYLSAQARDPHDPLPGRSALRFSGERHKLLQASAERAKQEKLAQQLKQTAQGSLWKFELRPHGPPSPTSILTVIFHIGSKAKQASGSPRSDWPESEHSGLLQKLTQFFSKELSEKRFGQIELLARGTDGCCGSGCEGCFIGKHPKKR